MQDEWDVDPEALEAELDPRRSVRRASWAVCLLAGLGLAVGAYLLGVSLSQAGLPLGCGPGSGCDEVLRSRWSTLFGVPVGLLAVLVYGDVVVGSVLVSTAKNPAIRETVQFGLAALAAAIVLSAAWFIALQFFVLREVCPWCMAEHAIGLLTAGAVFRLIVLSRSAGGESAERPRGLLPPFAVGTATAALFAVLQVFFGAPSGGVVRVASRENSDTGPGADRRIAVLDGKLSLDVHDSPILGSPDAPQIVVLPVRLLLSALPDNARIPGRRVRKISRSIRSRRAANADECGLQLPADGDRAALRPSMRSGPNGAGGVAGRPDGVRPVRPMAV